MAVSDNSVAVPARKDQFPEAINRLVIKESHHPEAHVLRIMARSPGTKAAREVMQRLDELHENGVEVQAVFLSIPTRGPGSAALKRLSALYGPEKVNENVRVAGFEGAGELLEQINFGRVAVWTGRPLSALLAAPPDKGQYVDTRHDQRTADMARGAFVCSWAQCDRLTKRELERLQSGSDSSASGDVGKIAVKRKLPRE